VTEISEGAFQAYVIALGVSGLLLLLAAAIGFGATAGSRVISALVGLAFLGYGIYLEFIMPADQTFSMFYYAFIVPVVVLVNVFRSRKTKAQAETASTQPAA
jgi:hypothetical protein